MRLLEDLGLVGGGVQVFESLPNQIGADFKCMTFVPMKPPVLMELLLQVEILHTDITTILSWKSASVSQCLKPD